MNIVGNDIEECSYDYGVLNYVYGIDFIYFKHQMVVKIECATKKFLSVMVLLHFSRGCQYMVVIVIVWYLFLLVSCLKRMVIY